MISTETIYRICLKALFWVVAMGFLLPGTVSAQEQDIEGSRDHPLISRYKGSYIDGYDVRGFDAFRLALGKRTTDAEGNLVPERKKI